MSIFSHIKNGEYTKTAIAVETAMDQYLDTILEGEEEPEEFDITDFAIALFEDYGIEVSLEEAEEILNATLDRMDEMELPVDKEY